MTITNGQNADASDFIDDSEKDGTASNDNGRVAKLEQVNSQDRKIAGTFHASPTVRVYTSDDTWSKPDKLSYIIVEVQGPGADGEGTVTTSNQEVGAGGGGGGYARALIPASDLGATEDIEVGTNASLDRSFFSRTTGDDLVGNAGSAPSSFVGGAGGTATGGDINVAGQRGGDGQSESTTVPQSGKGGDSMLGIGGAARYNSTGTGFSGTGYGSGGGGAKGNNGSDGANSQGQDGRVIITEYF